MSGAARSVGYIFVAGFNKSDKDVSREAATGGSLTAWALRLRLFNLFKFCPSDSRSSLFLLLRGPLKLIHQ